MPGQFVEPVQDSAARIFPRGLVMTRIRVDNALRFYHEVVGLEHLHYGLWDDEPLTLEGLKSAQERYAEYLISWIPEGVNRIVDVGCGVGALSALLMARGYEVEGLSPDPRQRELYIQRTGQPFHLTGFAQFDSARRFDLAMLSESAQYIRPTKDLFSSARLNVPGGYLLVSDYFVISEEKGPLTKSGHRLEPFLEDAAGSGFVIVREEDITDKVTPTLDFIRNLLRDRVHPSLRIIEESWGRKHPYVYGSLRWFLRKKLREFEEAEIMVDAEEFSRAKRYMIYLFRVPKA